MKVSEVMSESVVSVSPEMTVTAAAKLLSRHNIGSLPVTGGGGQVRGMITDRDIVLRCVALGSDPENTPVKDVMSRSVLGISVDADVREATRLMSEEQVRRLPVLEDGRLVGMITLGDMAKSNVYHMEVSKALTDISMEKE